MAADGPAAGDKRLQDQRRSFRQSHRRHAQQLRRRHDAVEHLSHRGREFPLLLLDRPARRREQGCRGRRRRSGSELCALWRCPAFWQAWGKFHDRFNVDKEPNEPNRFGWIVEIDPFDPNSVPVKHTPRLAASASEGAETVLNKDDRVVVLLRRRHARRVCLSLRHRRPVRP